MVRKNSQLKTERKDINFRIKVESDEYEIISQFLDKVFEKYKTVSGVKNTELMNALKLYLNANEFLKKKEHVFLDKDENSQIIKLFKIINSFLLEMSFSELLELLKFEVDHQWIRNFKKMGLINVFLPRRERKVREKLKEVYKEKLLSSKEIRLMGISLIDFFNRSDYDQGLYTKILEKAARDRNIKSIKMIILDPSSKSARHRIEVEQGKDVIWYNSQLVSDIKTVIRKLKNPTYEEMKKIQVRFAKEMPYSYCIICDDVFFIENYHSGNIRDAEGYKMDTDQICIGGIYVPYLMFSTSSKYGGIIKESFDRLFDLWEDNTIEKVEENLEKEINKTKNREEKEKI